MKILVTGGAGFIGSHVSDQLVGSGHEVVVVDNLSSGSISNLNPNVDFHQIDIRDDKCGDLFRTQKFDAIYHFAAQMDVRYSVRNPIADMEINIGGSLRLMEYCRETGVPKFIFASTGGAIYGEQDFFPASEDHPQRPVSPYGVSKLAVERYLYYFHVEYGLNAVALRFANVYGPRQNPHGEAGVIAIFSSKMLTGEQAFINGDGLQTRDYVYVEDIARANLAALKLDGFNTINLGTGVETDVIALYDRLNQLSGRSTERKHAPANPGEQRRSAVDPSLAEKILGWKPITDLNSGLAMTMEHFRRKMTDGEAR